MIHQLKIWPKYFDAIKKGTKTFEVRINDRDFKVGDVLALREYDPETDTYTGGQINREIGYVLESTSEHNKIGGIAPGYIVMSLLPYKGDLIPRAEQDYLIINGIYYWVDLTYYQGRIKARCELTEYKTHIETSFQKITDPDNPVITKHKIMESIRETIQEIIDINKGNEHGTTETTNSNE